MQKLLVLTLCQGEAHEALGKVTHPEMHSYAKKIGAEFMVCNCPGWPKEVKVPWQKLIHLWLLLEEWDRIIFFDNDVLVDAERCPNLFDMVPENEVGGYKEGIICSRLPALVRACAVNELPCPDKIYNGDYINTGVLVLSKQHRELFLWPDVAEDNFYEQSYINARIFSSGCPVFSLPYELNRMSVHDPIIGQQRHGAFIIHYAGSTELDQVAAAVVTDKAKFGTKAMTSFLVECTGGIGDVVYAEPIIRYMIEEKYKDRDDVEFVVSTQRPRIFEHFKRYKNVKISHGHEVADIRETPFHVMQAHPLNNNMVRGFCPYQAIHNLDFQAYSMLHDFMPDRCKTPELSVLPEDFEELRSAGLPKRALYDGKRVAVHMGRGWPTKTFPKTYWKSIIDALSLSGRVVVLFGKDDGEAPGVLDVAAPGTNCYDLRNKLSLGGMFALLKECPQLLTNESSPLCIAGAFDNEIYLIANPKEPNLLFPYRNGSVHYKTHAIRVPVLAAEARNLLPNMPDRVEMAELPFGHTIEDFLPPVERVLEAILGHKAVDFPPSWCAGMNRGDNDE